MQATGVGQVLSCQGDIGPGEASERPRLHPLRNERKAPGFLQQPHLTALSGPRALFSCPEILELGQDS